MTALPFLRTTRPALVALALVALQLVTALHFALVPHGFSAGLSGFVHVHEEAVHAVSARSESEVARRASVVPELISGNASCSSDSCPIGFAGHHSVLLGSGGAPALLAFVVTSAQAQPGHYVTPRSRVLLSAPKTSPPV